MVWDPSKQPTGRYRQAIRKIQHNSLCDRGSAGDTGVQIKVSWPDLRELRGEKEAYSTAGTKIEELKEE